MSDDEELLMLVSNIRSNVAVIAISVVALTVLFGLFVSTLLILKG